MKRTIFALATLLVVFVTLFVLAVVHPVRRVRAHQGCTEATLEGTYGLVATGWVLVAQAFPGNFSMLVTFDGKGGFTGDQLNIIAFEAKPAPPGLQLESGSPFMNVTGTYTVNADCSYTFTIGNVPENPWNAVITAYGVSVDTGGDEIMGNMYSSLKNTTATFDAKRVSIGKWNFFE